MNIVNPTSFPVEALPVMNHEGKPVVVVVVKGTFDVSASGVVTPSDKQIPVTFGDELPDAEKGHAPKWESDVVSFKPKTDDMREAPSLDLLPALVRNGHTVRAHDPAAMETARPLLPKEIVYVDDLFAAADKADTVVLLTEWDIFRGVDFNELKKRMKGADLFDGRNVYEPKEVSRAGLAYHGIGLVP